MDKKKIDRYTEKIEENTILDAEVTKLKATEKDIANIRKDVKHIAHTYNNGINKTRFDIIENRLSKAEREVTKALAIFGCIHEILKRPDRGEENARK